ncbi:MAG TPA: CHAD domain-containing protein [Sphingomicrobium sp.]|nr:CHAD domain-containing protein [Sphingomicrobium sp.]
MREIEIKLEVDPDDLPLVRQYPVLARIPSRSVHQITVYYDTPETRLKKHGLTLRVRSAGGKFIQTLKGGSETVGLVSREEIECEVPSLKPDLSLLKPHPLHALLAAGLDEHLEPTIVSDVDRTTWLLNADGEHIQVDLDYGTISAGEHSAEFAELEFELRDGQPSSLIIAARRLVDEVPARLGVLTKAERGAFIAEGTLGKVVKAAHVQVQKRMDVAQAFAIILHDCIKHYRLNEPVILERRVPAALHQARVAIRRLRSALSLFRPAIEDVEFQHLRHELRWFSAQLGDARNLDVYLERELDAATRAELTTRRERAYDAVFDAMNSRRYRRLLIDLVGWGAIGAWRTGKLASRPVESLAARRLDRLWKSITDLGSEVEGLNEERRHWLRIEGKKLRYAIEFLRGLYPDAREQEKRFSAALEQLQDSLGKLNDMATAKTLVLSASYDHPWLIGSLEERKHVLAAKEAMRELLRIGRFWSSATNATP